MKEMGLNEDENDNEDCDAENDEDEDMDDELNKYISMTEFEAPIDDQKPQSRDRNKTTADLLSRLGFSPRTIDNANQKLPPQEKPLQPLSTRSTAASEGSSPDGVTSKVSSTQSKAKRSVAWLNQGNPNPNPNSLIYLFHSFHCDG